MADDLVTNEDGPARTKLRSRRQILAGGLGALGVLGADALVKAGSAKAGTDGDVVLGVLNTETSETTIQQTSGGLDALNLYATTGDALNSLVNGPSNVAVNARNLGAGPGVFAQSGGGGEGVYGQSGGASGTTPGQTRNGVHGVTNSGSDSGVWGENVGGGYGVFGSTSTSGIAGGAGVAGLNNGSGPGLRGASQNGAGIYGFASTSEGLYARSGNTDGTTPGTTRSGVHGVTNSAGAGAVWGENVGGGDGVKGTSGGGNGVHGQATASAGVGVLAENTGGGSALQVNGPALFSRSGKVTFPSGVQRGTIAPPGGLTASALVLAVMQNVAGGVMVKAVVPDFGSQTFDIVLNKAPRSPATATVAWFVVN